MGTALKVFRYETRNVLRGRAILGYGLFFLVAVLGLMRMGGGLERALPSLANVILLAVPLVSVVFTTVFLYDGRPFNELLLSQPVARRDLFLGLYLGLTLPLGGAFLLGAGIPLVAAGGAGVLVGSGGMLLAAGLLLTAVFTALGFVVAFSVDEPARGLGAALLLWLLVTVVYDGVVLLASHTFSAYPLERPMLAAMVLNPVDLARLLALISVDASALLGYTGAVFQDFFGGALGISISMAALGAWVAGPYLLALRRFRRMDF
ncbi:MAG: ABC transporter permease subunit [Longimicrobiales bacterium]|nr:ABC transporter permease subunit [Longimicrobiales bacterium]